MKKAIVAVFVCFIALGLNPASSISVAQDVSEAPVVVTDDGRAIETVPAANNSFAGNTFDIVSASDFTISAIDVNVDPAGDWAGIDVYYRVGSSVGYENNASAWSFLGSYSTTAAGLDLPTFIDLAGNGIQFDNGQVYGIYVDLYTYTSGGIVLQYTNGQHTYSNAELSLTTNTGQSDPAFDRSFFPREWNGTIYYDISGPAYPYLDITCNGQDAGIKTYPFKNVKLDVQIEANDFAGTQVDIWVFATSNFGNFSFQWGNWYPGITHAAWTGGLLDYSGTVLDRTLPVGQFIAYLALDLIPNGQLDFPLYDYDLVDFEVLPNPPNYQYDDGDTENALGLTSGGDMCWIHRFDTIPGGESILNVHSAFGWSGSMNGPPNGDPIEVYVWDDPTNDGDPSDAVLLAQESGVVANTNDDILNVYTLSSAVTVSGQFFIGCNCPHSAGIYPAPMDTQTPYTAGDGWYAYTVAPGVFDPNDLTNNDWLRENASAGRSCYWLLRSDY